MLFSNQLPCYLSNNHLKKVFCCSPMPVHRFFRKRDEKHSFRVLPPSFLPPMPCFGTLYNINNNNNNNTELFIGKGCTPCSELTQLLQQQIQLSLLVSCLLCFVPTYHPNDTQILQAVHSKYFTLLLPSSPTITNEVQFLPSSLAWTTSIPF